MKHGTEQQNFETGAKRDTQADKLRYDLISPLALGRIAKVYTEGAKHYGDRNWEKGIPNARCFASLTRHVNAFHLGDTSEDHLAQAAWNAIAILHNQEAIKLGILPESLNDMPDYRSRVKAECNQEAPIGSTPKAMWEKNAECYAKLNAQDTKRVFIPKSVTDQIALDNATGRVNPYADQSFVCGVPLVYTSTPFSTATTGDVYATDHPFDGYYTNHEEGGLAGWGVVLIDHSRSTWFEPDLSPTEGIDINSPDINAEVVAISEGAITPVSEREVTEYVDSLLSHRFVSVSDSSRDLGNPYEDLAARVRASLQEIFKDDTTNDRIDLREDDAEEALKDLIAIQIVKLGASPEIAKQIVGGISFPNDDTRGLENSGKYVYIAGPMRGYRNFNFESFDKTRDRLLLKGYIVISPADMGRAESMSRDPLKEDSDMQLVYAVRDFFSLAFIRSRETKPSDAAYQKDTPVRGAIALLDGWCRSTGASAEFFVSRWLGLSVLDHHGNKHGDPHPEYISHHD